MRVAKPVNGDGKECREALDQLTGSQRFFTRRSRSVTRGGGRSKSVRKERTVEGECSSKMRGPSLKTSLKMPLIRSKSLRIKDLNAGSTEQKADSTKQKADHADQKADLADQKADHADQKADLADQKADLADQKADLADQKADLADQKADPSVKTLLRMPLIRRSKSFLTKDLNVVSTEQKADPAEQKVDPSVKASLRMPLIERSKSFRIKDLIVGSTDQKADPAEQKVDPAEQQADPSVKASLRMPLIKRSKSFRIKDLIVGSTDQKVDSAEQKVDPAEQQADPAEQQADPVEQQADPAEQKEDPSVRASLRMPLIKRSKSLRVKKVNADCTELKGDPAEQKADPAEPKAESKEEVKASLSRAKLVRNNMQNADSSEHKADSSEQTKMPLSRSKSARANTLNVESSEKKIGAKERAVDEKKSIRSRRSNSTSLHRSNGFRDKKYSKSKEKDTKSDEMRSSVKRNKSRPHRLSRTASQRTLRTANSSSHRRSRRSSAKDASEVSDEKRRLRGQSKRRHDKHGKLSRSKSSHKRVDTKSADSPHCSRPKRNPESGEKKHRRLSRSKSEKVSKLMNSVSSKKQRDTGSGSTNKVRKKRGRSLVSRKPSTRRLSRSHSDAHILGESNKAQTNEVKETSNDVNDEESANLYDVSTHTRSSHLNRSKPEVLQPTGDGDISVSSLPDKNSTVSYSERLMLLSQNPLIASETDGEESDCESVVSQMTKNMSRSYSDIGMLSLLTGDKNCDEDSDTERTEPSTEDENEHLGGILRHDASQETPLFRRNSAMAQSRLLSRQLKNIGQMQL